MTSAHGPSGKIFDNPAFLPFLPMLYIAWADGDLDRQELERFQATATDGDLLSAASKQQILTWLNAEQPPSSADLLSLLRHIRQISNTLPPCERKSLVTFGMSLVEAEEAAISTYWEDSANLRALAELETSLGFDTHEALFEILGSQDPQPLPMKSLAHEPTATFDVDAMRQYLDGRYSATMQQVRSQLQAPIFRFYPEETKESQRKRVMQWLKILADQGIGRKAYPEVFQGPADLGDFIATFETMAYFDLSLVVKMGVQFGLFGGAIYFLGTDEQRQQWLHDVASCQLLGCFAMSELGHGSNVRDLGTEAVFDAESDAWIIHTPREDARKEWIGGAAQDAQLAVVFAQLKTRGECHGVHAFAVPIRDQEGNPMPGIRIADCGHKMGLNGVDNGILWFDHVRIPRNHLLSRFASVDRQGQYTSPIASSGRRFFTMLGTLVGGRVSVGAAGVSVSKSALTIAIRYGAKRRQFGPENQPEQAILDYPSHQRRLIPRLAETYALNFAIRHLMDCYTGTIPTDSQTVEALAAAIKATSTWHNNATVQECRECCGGQGFLSINRLPALKADSDVFATFEGDNVVLMLLVAKSVLTQFRRQLADNQFFGTLRFYSKKILEEFFPPSFNVNGLTKTEIRHPETHATFFQKRQEILTWSLVRRLRKRIKSGMSTFDAFKECQNHALSLAKAYAEKIIHHAFWQAVQRTEDPQLKEQLLLLCQLYGLSKWEADLAWFQAHSRSRDSQGKKIPKHVTELCSAIRPQAVHLVQAFGIPENCLAAPIAFET